MKIIDNTEVLKSNLCHYKDAYILVKGGITVLGGPANFALFIKYIREIDGTTMDDAEDLDLVIPMYNLLEYSSNESDTTGSLWFYSNDKETDFNNDIENSEEFDVSIISLNHGSHQSLKVLESPEILVKFWKSRRIFLWSNSPKEIFLGKRQHFSCFLCMLNLAVR